MFLFFRSNQSELENFLQDAYNPASTSYRHFLSVQEFTARFGPTQEEYDAVIDFAKANGLTVVGTSPNRLNVDVTGTVANIEKAFHLSMRVYQHPTENRTFYAPDREPTVDLPFQLWCIAGLDNYSIPHPAGLARNRGLKSNATTGSGPSVSFLGSDMRTAYYGGTLTGSGQSLGLLEYYGTDLADLNTYFKSVGQTNNVPITLLSTDGTSTSCLYSQGCDDTEQTIDMTQGTWHGPGSVQPGRVTWDRRMPPFLMHGHGEPAERAIELVVDMESGRPEHRQPVLRRVRSPGSESVSSSR